MFEDEAARATQGSGLRKTSLHESSLGSGPRRDRLRRHMKDVRKKKKKIVRKTKNATGVRAKEQVLDAINKGYLNGMTWDSSPPRSSGTITDKQSCFLFEGSSPRDNRSASLSADLT